MKRGEPPACSIVKLLSREEDDNRRIGRERKTLIAERVFHVNRIKGLLFIAVNVWKNFGLVMVGHPQRTLVGKSAENSIASNCCGWPRGTARLERPV